MKWIKFTEQYPSDRSVLVTNGKKIFFCFSGHMINEFSLHSDEESDKENVGHLTHWIYLKDIKGPKYE